MITEKNNNKEIPLLYSPKRLLQLLIENKGREVAKKIKNPKQIQKSKLDPNFV